MGIIVQARALSTRALQGPRYFEFLLLTLVLCQEIFFNVLLQAIQFKYSYPAGVAEIEKNLVFQSIVAKNMVQILFMCTVYISTIEQVVMSDTDRQRSEHVVGLLRRKLFRPLGICEGRGENYICIKRFKSLNYLELFYKI